MALPSTALEWFNFYYPHFSLEGGPLSAPAADIEVALLVGEANKPICASISPMQQMQAVAHYAAYELGLRYANSKTGSGFSTESVLIREKEGDVERAWSAPKVATVGSVTGDDSPYARWQQLAALCPSVFTGFKLRSMRI